MSAAAVQFANYVETQPESRPAPIYQPEDWRVQPPAKKPPSPVGEGQVGVWERVKGEVPADRAVKGLDDAYVIEDRPAVARFIEEHHLHGLLLQAKQPLNAKFGEHSINTLSIVCDDEGFETLFCIVVTSSDLQRSREALRAFDREWWLSRAKQAAGRLNFDFSLI